jgi:methionyl aminopeptidase
MVVQYTPEQYDTWRKAAKIAGEVLAIGAKLIKNGSSLLEVSTQIDQAIFDKGGTPAWCSQLNFDHIAAHDCARFQDDRVFDNNVVKLDVGVHIDGFIGDNAVTVDLSGKYTDLVKASRDALNQVGKELQIGSRVGQLGKTIQDTIMGHGFQPVANLSGHTILQNVIHHHPTIPNVATRDKTELKDGQVIAIEPFATDGVGSIYETGTCEIFALGKVKPVRSPYGRQVLGHIAENYQHWPFAKRWLVSEFGAGKTSLALKELIRAGILRQHPPLVEESKGMVSQAEHTWLIGDKVECMTKSNGF